MLFPDAVSTFAHTCRLEAHGCEMPMMPLYNDFNSGGDAEMPTTVRQARSRAAIPPLLLGASAASARRHTFSHLCPRDPQVTENLDASLYCFTRA